MTVNTGTNAADSVPNQEFFTPNEVADLLRFNRRTILNWMNDPAIPLSGVKMSNNLWRIPRASLIEYLEWRYGQRNAG